MTKTGEKWLIKLPWQNQVKLLRTEANGKGVVKLVMPLRKPRGRHMTVVDDDAMAEIVEHLKMFPKIVEIAPLCIGFNKKICTLWTLTRCTVLAVSKCVKHGET